MPVTLVTSNTASAPEPQTATLTDAMTPLDAAAAEERNRKAESVLKKRFIGMVIGLVLAHVYIALALAYSYMDDFNHLHTCWLPLLGAFICSMIFVFHVSIS